MNKIKKFLIFLFLLLLPVFCFAENIRLSLPSLSKECNAVLPVDSEIGQTVQPDETGFHSLLSQAISTEFGYQWLETYVHSDSKASIAEVFTTFLTENLPAGDFVMSVLTQNGDGSVSISVRFGTSANSPVVDFVVDGSAIVAMSVKKSL